MTKRDRRKLELAPATPTMQMAYALLVLAIMLVEDY